MWAAKFKLPPNDERLLCLTAKEAIEDVLKVQAYENWIEEKHAEERGLKTKPPAVYSDEEARKLADTPHLTGDPEWDEIELAETSPHKAPIDP